MTHSLIGIIVYADNNEKAFDEAKKVMDNLIEHEMFDWYQTFKDEGHRFGNILPVNEAFSGIGRVLINSLMASTMESFYRYLSNIRKILVKNTDEELWKRIDETNMFRFNCNRLGSYGGNSIHLYDPDGEGIRDPKHLDSVLNKWPTLDKKHTAKYQSLTIYIVPFDAHS